MAKVPGHDLNPEEWDKWVATRPEPVRAMCQSHPPDRLYKMKTTGQRVVLVSYYENRTVRVAVMQRFNPELVIIQGFQVFGVSIDNLEECDIPEGA